MKYLTDVMSFFTEGLGFLVLLVGCTCLLQSAHEDEKTPPPLAVTITDATGEPIRKRCYVHTPGRLVVIQCEEHDHE